MVFAASAVELGNGNADVFHRGGEVGSYEMPDDELEETAGEDMDEGAVLDSLSATVASHADDALRASGPKV